MSRLMTEDELAAYLQVQPATPKNWRYKGIGPPVVKLAGNRVRYRREAVDQWLDAQTVEPETAAG